MTQFFWVNFFHISIFDIEKLIKAAKKKNQKVAEVKIAGLAGLAGLATGLGNQFNEKKKMQ